MTTYNDIRAALEAEIANVSGVPAAAQRCWENVRFEPTVGTAWVRMTLLPGETRPATMGANPQIRYNGLFQVDIFRPEGEGPGTAEALADAVRDRFNVETTLTSGSITVRFNWSEKRAAIPDSPWYQVPVLISWYTYAQ